MTESACIDRDTHRASIWVLFVNNAVMVESSSNQIDCRFACQARLELLLSKPTY